MREKTLYFATNKTLSIRAEEQHYIYNEQTTVPFVLRNNILFTMNKPLFHSCWYLDEAPTHGEVTCTYPYKVCRWADVGNSHQSDPKPSNLEIESRTKIPKCYPCAYSRRPPKRSEVVVCRSLHCVGQVGRGLPDVDGVKAGRRVNNVTLTATTIMKARAKPPP